MSLETFFWLMGGIGVLFLAMLSIIGRFISKRDDDIDKRFEKTEKWILSQQKEINELTKATHAAIKVIEANQQNDSRRLDIMEQSNKRAEEIIAKLRAITSNE